MCDKLIFWSKKVLTISASWPPPPQKKEEEKLSFSVFWKPKFFFSKKIKNKK